MGSIKRERREREREKDEFFSKNETLFFKQKKKKNK